jgi:hypothetical protein
MLQNDLYFLQKESDFYQQPTKTQRIYLLRYKLNQFRVISRIGGM